MNQATTQPAGLLSLMDSLADTTRLRLLHMLQREQLGVVDLCEVLQMPQSTVSRHLKVLSDQGWLVNRRRGTTNLYGMVLDELDPTARQLWQLVRDQTQGWPTLKQDAVRLEQRLALRARDARSFFAGAAGEWDRLRSDLYGERFTTAALAALLPSDWTIADLGCGTGQLVAQLAPNAKRIIGVDSSPAMRKAATKRTAKMRNVELLEGELEDLPIKDDTCDAALLVLVLTYIEEPPRVLAEMRRIIKPGGKAVIIDLLQHDRDDFRRDMQQRWPGLDPASLTSQLKKAGFAKATWRPLPPEPDTKGPALILATAT